MSDNAKLHFLPWLRSGAAAAVAVPDTLTGAMPANASIAPWIRIAGRTFDQAVRVRGPGHVAGIGAQAIVKREPRDGTADFEPNYFPFVELRPADLPWRYTPAAQATRSRLRPWLVLVVVRRQEGVTVGREPGAPLEVLRIEAPARPTRELPDLADASSWAHVQSTYTAAELPAALADDPRAAVARLVCPRRLTARETWLACLVPAFDVGVRAGLGEDGSTADAAAPAWNVNDAALDRATLRLPVYDWWSFSTAGNGDFEALARKLAPDAGDAVLGRVRIDVTRPGAPLPDPAAGPAMLADYVGALRSVGIARRPAPAAHQRWLDDKLEPVLEVGAQRVLVPATAPANYSPERDDPVVAPPLYGTLQTGQTDVPLATHASRGWMRALNLQPALRAAAGIGAAIVRSNQEALVASAWAQAAEARKAAQALDRAALSVDVGRSLARRIARSEPGIVLQATRRMHPWIASPASKATLASDLRHGDLPRGLVSAPFARAARPRTALGRAWSRRAVGSAAAPLAGATSTFVAATAPTAARGLRVTLDFAATRLNVGAWTRDPALEASSAAAVPVASTSVVRPPAAAATRARTAAAPAPSALRVAAPVVALDGKAFDGTLQSAARLEAQVKTAVTPKKKKTTAVATLDLSSASKSVVAGLDPLPRIQAGLLVRIPALSSRLGAGGTLPRRLSLSPVFSDALCWDVVRLDARYLIPGAETLADNRVALLEVENDTVAAILAGANHEMSRELVWREFPTTPSNTFFRRFWDSGDNGADDTGPISGWIKPALGQNLTGVGASRLSVILVRGDLVRRYPDAHVYVCRGTWSGNRVVPDPATVQETVLQGALDARSNFYGFALSAPAMRGIRAGSARTPDTAGWFVVFEQAATGPRFGLDAAAADGSDLTSGAADWNALSWGHLVPKNRTLDDLTHAAASTALPNRTPPTMRGLTWGRNAAHVAAITWQRPLRLFIHADRLLPP